MSNPESTPESSEPRPRARRHRRRWLFASGLGIAALAGLFATRAWAHGPHHGRFGRVQSQADLRDKLGRGADFALYRVNASELQRERVSAILDQAAPGLFTTHQQGAKLRRELMEAVASGNRTGAETARRQGLVWADEASRLWLGTVEQTLAVLDDAQRAKVREHLSHFTQHGPH